MTLAVLNHDDDVLFYRLHDRGKLVDQYESKPGYFDGAAVEPAGGDARALCKALGVATSQFEVEQLLHGDNGYVFELERHTDLVRALDLPMAAVGAGFASIATGERPDGVKALLRTSRPARGRSRAKPVAAPPPPALAVRTWTAVERAIVDLHIHYLLHAHFGGDVWYLRYRKLLPADRRSEVDALFFALARQDAEVAEIETRIARILDAVWDVEGDHLAIFDDPGLQPDHDPDWDHRLQTVRQRVARG